MLPTFGGPGREKKKKKKTKWHLRASYAEVGLGFRGLGFRGLGF